MFVSNERTPHYYKWLKYNEMEVSKSFEHFEYKFKDFLPKEQQDKDKLFDKYCLFCYRKSDKIILDI